MITKALRDRKHSGFVDHTAMTNCVRSSDGQQFQDLGHSFSLNGPPRRRTTYVSKVSSVLSRSLMLVLNVLKRTSGCCKVSRVVLPM